MRATLFFLGLSLVLANTNIFLLTMPDNSILYKAGDYLPGMPQQTCEKVAIFIDLSRLLNLVLKQKAGGNQKKQA
jgi:hypothetical protein